MSYKRLISHLLILCICTYLCIGIIFETSHFIDKAYASSGVTFDIDLNLQGKDLDNKFDKLGCWDFNAYWLDKAEAESASFFSNNYPFIEDVQFLMATGGSYCDKKQSIVYDDVDGMTGTTVTALFGHTAEVIDDFKFWVYTDADGWQQIYQWSITDTLINSDSWTKRVYSITSTPAGVKWFSIQFPTDGRYDWNPQLSKVQIACTSSITDDLDDWSEIWIHSDGLKIDTQNGEALGDTSRVCRTDPLELVHAERITYNYSGVTSAEAIGLYAHYHEVIDDFKFYTSSDGALWTQYTSWTKSDTLINGNTWTKRVYTLGSIPSGTDYFKIEFPVGGKYSWNPQLSQVKITTTTTITDDLDDWTKIDSRTSELRIDTQNGEALGDSSRACRENNNVGYPGCNTSRDLFKEPHNRNVMTDYDFSELIRACDNVLDQGIKPRIKTGNVPIKFSSSPDIDVYGINVRPPDDYDDYYDYINAIVDALVTEFGINEVRTWSWGVYNEFENSDIFEASDETAQSTKIAFFELYDYTVAALEEALGASNVIVGAHCMTTATDLWDPRDFIDHCATGTNYYDSGTGTQLDYIAYSYYDNKPNDPGDYEESQYIYAMTAGIEKLREKAISVGLTDLEFGVDEGGTLYGPDAGEKVLGGRLLGHSYEGSRAAYLYKKQNDIDMGWFSLWSLNSEDVWGEVPGVWTNIANLAYKAIDDKRVDVYKSGTPNDSDNIVDAIAGFDSSSDKVHIMAFNHNTDMDSTSGESVTINVNNIAPVTGSTVTVKKWIVDDTHANHWSTWWQDRSDQGYDDSSYWSEYYSVYSMQVPIIAKKQSVKDYWYSRESTYKNLAALSYSSSNETVTNNSISLTTTIAHHGVVFYEITNAKLTSSPSSTSSIVDHLDDWSKCYSTSSGLALDTANPSIVLDSSRVCRDNTNASPAEYITYYKSNDITAVHATGLFASSLESIVDFKFYTSPGGSTWTQQTGWSNIDTSLTGGWTRREYRLDSVPSGTKHVKVEFPTGGSYSWNPQLGRVKIITKMITDDMDNWYVLSSHTQNLDINTQNAEALEDPSRICRTSTSTTESVYYYALGMKSVSATVLYATQHEAIDNLKFYTSSDRITWTEQTSWSYSDELINEDTWTRRIYTLDSIPSNTKYIKITFPTGGSYTWNPQLGKVEIIY